MENDINYLLLSSNTNGTFVNIDHVILFEGLTASGSHCRFMIAVLKDARRILTDIEIIDEVSTLEGLQPGFTYRIFR